MKFLAMALFALAFAATPVLNAVDCCNSAVKECKCTNGQCCGGKCSGCKK